MGAALALVVVAALLIGMAVIVRQHRAEGRAVSWNELLAPYSRGTALPHDFRLERIARGTSDVVLSLARPTDGARVEVHVVRRGQWSGVRESRSFGIGYEVPHSNAPLAEADDVTAALAAAIGEHDDGLPAPDQIALAADDTDALPWWFGLWRGGRGTLLGLNLIALALIGLVRTHAAALLGAVVAAADAIAAATAIPSAGLDVPGWLVMISAALLLLASATRPAWRGRIWMPPVVIFAAAWLLRVSLGAWSPLRINGLGPLWIAGAAGTSDAIATYGSGYRDLFAPIVALAPTDPDWAIFAANSAISAVIAPLAFMLARRLQLSWRTAALAASLLALDPVAVAGAATESYFPIIAALCTAAAIALVTADLGREHGRPWQAAAAVLSAALLLTQAARIHPAAWGAVAVTPFVVFAPLPLRWTRCLVFACSGLLVGGVLAATTGTALIDVLVNVRTGMLMQPPPPPSWRPLAFVAALTIALAVITHRLGLAVAAAAAMTGLLLSRHVYGQSAPWQQSYDRLYLVLPVIAVAAAMPIRLLHSRIFIAISALVVALAWYGGGQALVAARTTDQLEYRWLRDRIARLPVNCRVVYVASAGKRNLLLPTYVGLPRRDAVEINFLEPQSIARAVATADCTYYVHGSLCSSVEGRAPCDTVERHLTLAPADRASFPARPSNQSLPYDRDPVETWIARVDRIDGRLVDEAAP